VNEIFVFGSNLAGIHGAGSASHARQFYGARLKVGKGRTGYAYALPTKDKNLQTLSLYEISEHVQDFINYAKAHPELLFRVVEIGCGLAGYTPEQIAPLFEGAPANCKFSEKFRKILAV
jgi:hypothetical protein